MNIRRQFGLLGHHGDIHVFNGISPLAEQGTDTLEKSEAGNSLILRIGIGKVTAQIPKTGRPQEGISQGMAQNIGIRMTGQSLDERQSQPRLRSKAFPGPNHGHHNQGQRERPASFPLFPPIQEGLGHHKVLGSGDLDIGVVPRDQGDRMSQAFHQGGVIRSREILLTGFLIGLHEQGN